MLVLTRKLEQEIVIGDGIRIRVLKCKGNSIRLGIEAPNEVRIVRGELAQALDADRRATADCQHDILDGQAVREPHLNWRITSDSVAQPHTRQCKSEASAPFRTAHLPFQDRRVKRLSKSA